MSIKSEIKSLKKRLEKLSAPPKVKKPTIKKESPGEDIVLLTPEEIAISKKEHIPKKQKTLGKKAIKLMLEKAMTDYEQGNLDTFGLQTICKAVEIHATFFQKEKKK